MKPFDHLSDAELTWLAAAASRLPDAPPAWIDAALALWRAQPGIGSDARMPSLLKRIAAALSFDSWGIAPAALSVRTLPSDVRHLLYSAEGRDIDVRITPAADRFCLAGQILGPDEIGEVELTAVGEAGRRVTQFDPLGEFWLDGLHAGTYRIALRIGSDEIVLPPIVIRQRNG